MEKEPTSLIQLNDLTTGYRSKGKDTVISNRLCATLHTGEMTCLLGPNGAGKSTLLRTLAGFQPPLEGEIIVGHKPLSQYGSKELARLISVVLTDNSNIRNMTVEEVVAVGRSPYTGFWGTLHEKDRKVVEKCLQWVGITALKQRKMQTLSDGERQKVMIAKALAQQTPIIYLDEPTAFLDFPSKVDVLLLLRRICQEQQKTIFLSTHDLELALQTADCIWLMEHGRNLTTGSPRELADDGTLRHFVECDGISFDSQSMTVRITTTAL